MSKLHTTYTINYKGEVSYSFWHEDGDGIVWSPSSEAGGRHTIELHTKAVERCQAIRKALANLEWE